jgi:MFS family permease
MSRQSAGLWVALDGGARVAAGAGECRQPPLFLAYSTELAPRDRGALFGIVALTNQGGFIVGSAVGARVVGGNARVGLVVAAMCQGALAARLVLPLLRRRMP